MQKRINLICLTILFIMTCLTASCDIPQKSENEEPVVEEETSSVSDQLLAAETLAKRLVLYKLAFQEGDLAPFTAMPEALEEIEIPDMAKLLNDMWWTIEWETARLAPLPSTEITGLETVVFPLIASNLEISGDDDEWLLFSLGYDPDVIRTVIANAHSNWQPEQREVYLNNYSDDCLQVWCVNISGEWKLVSHLPCQPDVSSPTPPELPDDLFVSDEPESPAETDDVESENDDMNE